MLPEKAHNESEKIKNRFIDANEPMTPINNSDTAWLITTDFNQDNGIFYEDLKEDILNPAINQWEFECKFVGGDVGDVYISGVGCCGDGVGGNI